MLYLRELTHAKNALPLLYDVFEYLQVLDLAYLEPLIYRNFECVQIAGILRFKQYELYPYIAKLQRGYIKSYKSADVHPNYLFLSA